MKDGRGRASDGSHRARLREDVMMDQRLMSLVAVSEDGRARTRNAQCWNCCCSSKPTNDRWSGFISILPATTKLRLTRVILLSFASPRVHLLASWPGQGHLKIFWWSEVIVVWRVVYSDSFSCRCALMMGADDQGRNRGTYPCIHSIRAKPWRYSIITKVGGYKGLGWQILLHVVLSLKGWY